MFNFKEYDKEEWLDLLSLLALAVLLICLIFTAVMMVVTQDVWWCGTALIVAIVNQFVTGIVVKDDGEDDTED